ncbi:tetratricopeptide (TPR) repeat protein [Croceifilum oryzae]|uniref:Tetratricopeptide (TPR) repeat protein n=1 Tax=Croceifilum oryzae TaxID=1553429 RepID=A0AAJ1WUN6_9BACL|nr:helix-turn-helix domain-containing protein [Croceifilum oryzae]MDQ0418151.1 tetratricopeptide (TPR) repeat protein [Croceifilum oryzae]
MSVKVEGHLIQLEDDIIRYVLKRRRVRELDMKMDDLFDHTISKGSISNIEKARGKVSAKTLEIYLEKLGLKESDVLELAEKARAEIKEVYYQLEAIETIIEFGDLKSAKEQLDKMDFEEYHPLTPFTLYLRGRIFYEERKLERAEKQLELAIKLCTERYNLNPKDNIIASCFSELSKCRYVNGDLHQAIKYVNDGLETYDANKKGEGVKYQLLGNKVMYLLKLSRNDEASKILDTIWSEVSNLDQNYGDYPILNIYKFRSTILRNQNLFTDALQCCDRGLQIARTHRNQKNHYLDFLIISGSIFLLQKDFTKAFDRFMLVLNSDKEFKSPRRHIDSHTYLGIFYIAHQDWEKATKHLEEALQIGRKHTDAFRMAKTLIVRGNVHYYQGQFMEALVYYKEASRIAEEHGYKQRQYTALLKSADCFDNMKEEIELGYYLIRLYRLQKELNIRSEEEVYEVL